METKPAPTAPAAKDENDSMPRWSAEALARLAVAENEMIELQQAIVARGDPAGQTEIAMLFKLRSLLLLVADARHFLLYDIPATGSEELKAEYNEIVRDLRAKFEHQRKVG